MRINPLRALLSFMYFNDPKLLAFAPDVITSITGNSKFPNSATLLADLVKAQEAYGNALSLAKDRSRMQIEQKNICKIELQDALKKMCDMVNYVAQGDRMTLLSSGFDLSKEAFTPSILMPAKNVVVKYGETSGQLDVSVQGVKGHKGLSFEYAVADSAIGAAATNWITKPSGTTSCTITNMPVGQKVLIRVGIAGARKQIIYTEPVAKLVA